ncbi:hypothetical protein MN116_002988 [Schistosoma mekongi]|uniref:Uncharacterized protein n=1 Tax=Schistosoma mekongi TaxID=38744 RepID=A0AAE2D6X3_SCHME|nr:hypothetical protein MN116_002988 [Schistosoma mekongi]
MVNPHTAVLTSALEANHTRSQDTRNNSYDLVDSSPDLISLFTHSLQPAQSTFITSNSCVPICNNINNKNNNHKNKQLSINNVTGNNCSSINSSCTQSVIHNKGQQVAEYISTNHPNKLHFLLNSMTINTMLQNGETANHASLTNSKTHCLQTDIIVPENKHITMSQNSHPITSSLSHSPYLPYRHHDQTQMQLLRPPTVPPPQQPSITGISYHHSNMSDNHLTNGQTHYILTATPNGIDTSHTTMFSNHIQTSPVALIPEVDYNKYIKCSSQIILTEKKNTYSE